MSENIIPRHVLSSGRVELMTRDLLARLDEPTGPQRSRHPRRAVITAAAAACVAAAAVASVPLLSAPAWAASSDALSGAALRAAQLDCTTRLSRLPNASQLDPSPRALAEKRGSTTSTMLVSGSSLGVCVGSEGQRYGALVDLPTLPTSPGPVRVDLAVTVAGPEATGVVAGRVGADVASVTLETSDGRSMEATTQDGYFLAWWPSAARPNSLTALRADGSAMTRLGAEQLSVTGPPEPTHS
jgi:hypothetical protein